MARLPPRNPLIAIVGATGTGKSQLAVELAKRYNGEVINGDAMQLYSGLPIITNKITCEEQQGIPHHLLGCIGPGEQTWVVGTFVKKALATIDDIRGRGRLPILVGGTHYYLQSLLFQDKLAESEHDETEFVKDTAERWPILKEDTATLLAELRMVDPIMADRWHPNDRRKIQRSLEIYLQTGRKASDIYADQRHSAGEHDSETRLTSGSASLRFPSLLFWIHAEPETLNARLEKRVDKMLEAGLLDEVQELAAFAAREAAEARPVDETRGIWVSIGYKEFKYYLRALQSHKSNERELMRLKAEAIERTNIATRQYAKRQVRWIRIKLVNSLRQANASDNFFLLDGSDIAKLDENVIKTAASLADSFLNATSPLPLPSSVCSAAADLLTAKRDHDLSAQPQKWMKQHCELCGVTCVTEDQWTMHTKSKAHRKLKSKQSRAHSSHVAPERPG